MDYVLNANLSATQLWMIMKENQNLTKLLSKIEYCELNSTFLSEKKKNSTFHFQLSIHLYAFHIIESYIHRNVHDIISPERCGTSRMRE